MTKVAYYLRLIVLPIIMVTLSLLFLTAQSKEVFFEEYGVKEGLPEEVVSSIIQDDQGFIWFTTQNGLVKYDGYGFEILGPSRGGQGKGSLQPNNLLDGMVSGKNDKLWMGGRGDVSGLVALDLKTSAFQHYLYKPGDSLSIPFEMVLPLLEDHSGNMWFLNYSLAFERLDTMVLCRLDQRTGISQSFPSVYFRYDNMLMGNGRLLESTADQGVWLLNEKGVLCRWNDPAGTFEQVLGKEQAQFQLNDSLTFINQSKNGQMLLCGLNSLYLWDPVNLKIDQVYKHSTDNLNSLAKGSIYYAIEDIRGSLWVFQEGPGITVIDPVTNTFKHHQYGKGDMYFPDAPGIDESQLSDVHFLDDGPLLTIGMDSSGIWFRMRPHWTYLYYDFNMESFRFYDRSFNTFEKKLPTIYFPAAGLMDHSGSLWLNFRPNLFKMQEQRSRMTLYTHQKTNPYSLPSDTVLCLFEDSQANVWIGTNGGLARYDSTTDRFRVFRHDPADPGSISDNNIHAILEDERGKIWVATANGLNRWEPMEDRFQRFIHAPKGKNDISTIMVDQNSNLWCAVLGKGVFVLDSRYGSIQKSFLPDKDDTTSLLSDQINFIYQDSRGNIWLADPLGTHGLFRYDEQNERFVHYEEHPNDTTTLSSNAIRFLYEDPQHRFWIGTNLGGTLNEFDYEENRLIRYGGTLANGFFGAIADDNGGLWLRTYAAVGLVFFDPESGKTDLFGEEKGLLHNDIATGHNQALTLDQKSRLWLPTQRGLSVFDTKSRTFNNYFKKHGFQPYGRQYKMITTKNGNIWIGGEHGLNRIDPKQLTQKNTVTPRVWITSVEIMDSVYSNPDGKILQQTVPFTEKIQLAHWQKDLTFQFVALHYLHPEDNQYSWKLEEYDQEWSPVSKERSATYTNLSPGQYTFRVRAANADGVWNEEGAALTITIAPPWWQTTWAYLLWLLLIGLGLYGLYAYNLRRQLAIAETRRMKELDRLKSRLYTNITHEFRTPLTVIMGMTEQLTEGQGQASFKEKLSLGLELIQRNGQNLLRLINQLLDLSKLDSGKLKVNMIQGDIAAYLQYLTESFYSMAEDKGVRLICYSEEDSLFMDYDEEKIQHIVYNLLSNAIKFTPKKGKVVFHIQKKEGSKASLLELKIKDTGTGIAPEKLPFIFDRFYQADDSSTRQEEGTGIGLAITKELVELMEGTIQVKSTPAKGTTFLIRLPISREAPLSSTVQRPAHLTGHFTPETGRSDAPLPSNGSVQNIDAPLLLVIEDNPDVLLYIQSLLKKEYQIYTAENGQTGIDMAIDLVPDVVISDVMMPEKDGYEVCRTLKQDEHTSHIPIILLTARAGQEDRIEGLQYGADAYLTKPFQKRELKIRLEKLVEIRQKMRAHFADSGDGKEKDSSVSTTVDSERLFIQKLRENVQAQINDPDFGVPQLAQSVLMNQMQIYRKLKALTGKTPSQFIRSIRLQKGKELLLTTDLTISEIAYQIGFSDPNYFSKTFHSEFKKSPRDFRK